MITIVGNDIVRSGRKIGYILGNDIYSSEGVKLGFVQENHIFDHNGRKIAWLENDYIKTLGDRKIRIEENRRDVSGGAVSDSYRAAIRILIGD